MLVGGVAQVVPDGPHIATNETIPDYLGKYHIPVDEHWTTTDDGYILKIFRMPRPGAPVLLLQHGILCSAWDWMINSPSIAPAIQLYNDGYDVWLTNSRGNTFSRNHTTLHPTLDKEFWNFTFADMGRFDVPANIKYILKHTGKQDLCFVGWSQGNSQFFVAMTDENVKPYVDKTVKLFVAVAPVTWMKHQKSKLFSVLTDLRLDDVLDGLFPYGFLEEGGGVDSFAHIMCKLTAGVICKFTVDLFCGRSALDTESAITNLTAHFPAGVSVKEIRHYSQSIRDYTFRDFDYGRSGNLKHYGRATPPNFINGTKKIEVPTALFIGGKDDLGDVKDVATLIDCIGDNPALVFSKVFPQFSHLTYFDGTGPAFQSWYPELQGLLRKYNPITTQLLV